MAGELDGTVALVTGASSGIGEATARALAARGATVALVARRRDRLETLAAEIKEQDGSALIIPADVTQQEQAEAAVQRTVEEFGRLDILVNNAGVMLLGPVMDAPTEEWDRMVSVNVLGLLYVAHAAAPHLLKAADSPPRRVADLVNVGSVAGRRARAGAAIYNLTKFGVGAFSEALRQEVTRRHVRVSVIEPGLVDTELATHMRAEVRQQSMRRFEGVEPLQAEDIADAIAYIVTRPRRVAVNELLVLPTEQES
jgi:NADP-dependent 3-hydroxy acid dehydrogenase YdfG